MTINEAKQILTDKGYKLVNEKFGSEVPFIVSVKSWSTGKIREFPCNGKSYADVEAKVNDKINPTLEIILKIELVSDEDADKLLTKSRKLGY